MRYLSGNVDGAHWNLVSPEERVLKRLWFPSESEATRALENHVASLQESAVLMTSEERGVILEALFNLEIYFEKQINRAQTLATRSRISPFEYEEQMEQYQRLVARRETLQALKKRVWCGGM